MQRVERETPPQYKAVTRQRSEHDTGNRPRSVTTKRCVTRAGKGVHTARRPGQVWPARERRPRLWLPTWASLRACVRRCALKAVCSCVRV